MKMPTNLGMLLLAVWLIVGGALILFQISFPSAPVILAVLAIAAGILLLLGR